MLYLYLDESGDLGFDFISRQPSNNFTIAVLAVKGEEQNQAIANAIKVTLRRKAKTLRGPESGELKGSRSELQIKEYFYKKARATNFKVYAITLNKRHAYHYMLEDKGRVYNYIARMVLEKISFSDSRVRVILTVDKSKSKLEIADFNEYIIAHIKSRLDPHIPLEIFHRRSHETLQLQAADLFAWGIFRKHERGDKEWYDFFKEKIGFDGVCLG
jgi:hypothetical protein